MGAVPLQDVLERDAEPFRDPLQRLDGDAALSRLDPGNVATIEVEECRQRLLRDPLPQPITDQQFAESHGCPLGTNRRDKSTRRRGPIRMRKW